jgi:ectoine hydroxylase-related dioxygenase (phytanoyl-CoA dioxygenase family)
MHNDYDYDYVKSLVYLSPVTKKQGPFSYIPESHKWQREHSLSFFIKETEMELNKHFKAKNMGRANYYRRAMGIPEGRSVFYGLPSIFQQLSHFGDDVMPDTDLCKDLLSKEWQITSEDGNFAFFTGGTGIHRGSNVEEGERWAFQITLTREPDIRKKITSFGRYLTGTIMNKVLGEQRMVQVQKKLKTVI